MTPANKTTPISTSDTHKQMMADDSKRPSTSSSRSVIETKPALAGGNEDGANNKPAPTTTPDANRVESARRQQDREFFRRFLQPDSHQGAGITTGELGERKSAGEHEDGDARSTAGRAADPFGAAGLSSKSSAGEVPGSSSSTLIDHLPQLGQSFQWAPAYAMPLIYSTFGNQTDYQGERSSLSIAGGGGNGNSGDAASSSFFHGLNSVSGANTTDRMFQDGLLIQNSRANHLLPDKTTAPFVTTNEPSGAMGFDLTTGLQSKWLVGGAYQRNLEQRTGLAPGRTYSSVLNNPQTGLGSAMFEARRRSGAAKQEESDFMVAAGLRGPPSLTVGGQKVDPVDDLMEEAYWAGPESRNHRPQRPYQQMALSVGSHCHPSGDPLRLSANPAPGRHRNSAIEMVSGQARNHAPDNHRVQQQQQLAGSAPSSAGAAKRRNKLPSSFGGGGGGGASSAQTLADSHGAAQLAAMAGHQLDQSGERHSRKVFVGGLPPDIDEEEIKASFRRFGALVVDWPHKAESKSYFPPKGYAFLLFQEETSVQALIDSCFQEEDKLYLCVSSPTIKDKPVQIRPWRLSDTDYVLDSTLALDPRKTVFVGGVPRPLKASELANIMNNLYGGVCYAGIDTDPELKYPKGAGRVAFSNHQSYIAAISARFVHIHHGEIEKRVEVKPYVLDDQFCDECHGFRCANKFAPFFCANITCLRYYCESCWSSVHLQAGREFHKPLVKEGGDRPRGAQSFRW